ncbi:dihydroorotase [Sphingomicrobium marinum]|uniref:dihydroorotase n=1 Tax=Sphingomicrobium marinum TaxID=1227950 RepID=UPI002240BB03|nr:dihydroorotase [Sphingomicrobium marinum]
MAMQLIIRRPDDWHLHFRDGAMMERVVPFTARQFERAIVMPNLVPPVTSIHAAREYRKRIMAAVPDGMSFTPLMTAYLTDNISADEVETGHRDGVWTAAKLYPAGATTNSDSAVTDVANLHGVLDRMEAIGMPLCVHGEVTGSDVDVFDREARFIDEILLPLIAIFPDLKVVFEHITTKDAVDFVLSAPANVAATITPQHLMLNRNALFEGGLRPHAYCLPVVKRERHRLAVRAAATSGDPKFFLGTDSAPHPRHAKESACGCAGIFNAPHALECYAQVFEEEGVLDRLEGFASEHGPAFYGLPLNEGTVTLEKVDNVIPDMIENGDDPLVPFRAGQTIPWKFVG